MTKLCGRITDHTPHFWTGRPQHDFDTEGFLRTVEYRCPGHVAIEGGQRRHHTCKESR